MKKTMLLLLAVAGAAVSGMAEKPFAPKSIVFGHMGERVEAPENTLRAYRFAIDNGFPIEFDIYMTKDGELIATHDTNLKAKAGIDKHPTNCCWKGELEDVDLGAWKKGSWMGNWKGKGIRYPRIDEILAILPEGSVKGSAHLLQQQGIVNKIVAVHGVSLVPAAAAPGYAGVFPVHIDP